MSGPSFSIIVPVYNTEQYLRGCLDSILWQTCSDWECICVDDGSTDQSSRILDEYANEDSRFRVIHQANAGPGLARNAAIDVASGDWLLFVDADDLIAPYTLDTVKKMSVGADVVRMGLKRFPADCDFLSHLTYSERFNYSVNQFSEITYSLYMDGWPQFAYRRELVGNTRLKPYIVGEDIVFKLEYFEKAHTIAYTDRLTYGYRTNFDSITHRKFSYRILHDDLLWRMDSYRAMKSSGKVIDPKIIDQEKYFWKWLFPTRSCALSTRDAICLLNEWYSKMPVLLSMEELSIGQKAFFRVLLWLPHRRSVVTAICCWPYKLRMLVSGFLKKIHLRK